MTLPEILLQPGSVIEIGGVRVRAAEDGLKSTGPDADFESAMRSLERAAALLDWRIAIDDMKRQLTRMEMALGATRQ